MCIGVYLQVGWVGSVRNTVNLGGGGGCPYPKLLAGLNRGLTHDPSS